jgi:TonB-linked SusC/RagA family outer membrane protein
MVFQLYAGLTYSQNMAAVSLRLHDVTVEEAINMIEQETSYSFLFTDKSVDIARKVSIHVNNGEIADILGQLLRNTDIGYQIIDRQIILAKSRALVFPPQDGRKTVAGTVVDDSDEPIAGANIMEKGTANGTVTDVNGRFSLTVAESSVLQVSFIGYITQEVGVSSMGGGISMVIKLLEDTQALDEVVVIGYATGNKRSVSGVVEKVRREDMNTGVVTQPLDALKGKVAGVVISSVGGDPTSDMNIRIRGTTSLSGGNEPLVIIDGVFGDLNMFRAISPSDIESLTILKDASETAQYGSRGASGVIVVTTQRGRSGFSQIEYNGLFGVNRVYRNIDMLSADEWRAGARALGLNTNDMGGNTNWQNEIERQGMLTQTHNVSFTNGSEKSSLRASLGYINNPGLLENSGIKHYTVKIDAGQYAFDRKLKVDLGVFGSRRESDQQYDMYRTFYSAASYNPTYPNRINPETGRWDEDPVAIEVYNPLGMLTISNRNFLTHMNVNGRVNYEITDGLNLAGFGSYTYFSNNQRRYIPNDIQQGLMNGNGLAQTQNRERNDMMGNIQLSYVKDIGMHSLNVLALLEAQKQTYFESMARARGFETNYFEYNNLQAGANVSWGDATSNATEYALLSYMVRANYMYGDRYVATVNIRRDGSSKLGAGNKWGFFPSASAAWILSNESFMADLKAVNNLKLRAGYGVTGNQEAISPYNSLSLMSPNGTTLVDGAATTTFNIASNPNPDLRWEKKYTFDAGLDLTMFDSRLRFTADYYASRTKDMLYTYSVPMPPFVYSTMLANIGEMTNNGFEFALSGDIVRNRDFTFTAGLNLSFQKNELTSLSGTYMGTEFTTSKFIQLGTVNATGLTQYAGVTYLTEGQPIGVFYVPHAKGLIEKEAGKFIYDIEDLDGDGSVELTDSGDGDRYIAGQSIPKTYLGGSLGFRYKQFDLTTQLNGAFGHKILNGTALTFSNLSSFPTYNVIDGALEKSIYDIKISDYYLEKGDYVNVEYITLGYNLPVNRLKVKNISALRLAFSVNNVVTFTSYSGLTPLINSTNTASRSAGASGSGALTLGVDDKLIYPLSRVYSLSVGIKF